MGEKLSGSDCENASSSKFEAVGDEGGARVKIGAHPVAGGVPSDVGVVEETLEPPGDLLVRTCDQRPYVPGFEMPVATTVRLRKLVLRRFSWFDSRR